MPATSFQTNPVYLLDLLERCDIGQLQLPDFQRSWVWDLEKIRSLIASISQAFPVGALMALTAGGEVNFNPRVVEGAPPCAARPEALLLDGQQRITSLYQVAYRGKVVETFTDKKKKVKRWFYLDIRKCLEPGADRELAIVDVPEDKIIKEDFNRTVVQDLSSDSKECAALLFPVGEVFDWDGWQDTFYDVWKDEDTRTLFKTFKKQVLENFKTYQVPVITLDRATTKEAVCVVFEKVNTGGKALDAFELVTATYAADGYELRKDWLGDGAKKGRRDRLSEECRLPGSRSGVLGEVASTDFLQAIALFHNRARRKAAEASGKLGKELPSVTPNRQALLDLPLSAYQKYEWQVEQGFKRAARFLLAQHIYRVRDLPYQSQVVPLAAILADIGDGWDNEKTRAALSLWFWNGVFGELYGSATESRFGRDFLQVPDWLNGGDEPLTISEAIFRADRLKTMRMRLSAAYKGVNALLMKEGAEDFSSGQPFDHTTFFDENVDIHHIFPQDWCKKKSLSPKVFDSIINKTPLTYKTNRMIGGVAPSDYLARLEKGTAKNPGIDEGRLDEILVSHLIDPVLLRQDSFQEFMSDRQSKLLRMIETAMGKKAHFVEDTSEDPDEGTTDSQDSTYDPI